MTLREAIRPFNERAAEYDGWFEENPVFAVELAALQALGGDLPRPRLEIGVGPGRFAQALGIEFGIDPALAPLQLARRRAILAAMGRGEELPIGPAAMGTVYLLFTLCFLADPAAVLQECARVLQPHGRLVVGLIPGESPWGRQLSEKGRAGDPFYRHARFRTLAETSALLGESGFLVREAWSTLRQPPGLRPRPEPPVAGMDENAGFCVLMASR